MRTVTDTRVASGRIVRADVVAASVNAQAMHFFCYANDEGGPPAPHLRAPTLPLPIDPSSRIDRASFFGHLCGLLTACDDFDVSLLFRTDSPYTHLSVPQSVGELGVYFDPIASVVRLDDH